MTLPAERNEMSLKQLSFKRHYDQVYTVLEGYTKLSLDLSSNLVLTNLITVEATSVPSAKPLPSNWDTARTPTPPSAVLSLEQLV